MRTPPLLEVRTFSRDQLLTEMSRSRLDAAIRAGELHRVRRGLYCPSSAPVPVVGALTVGGLVDCVSFASVAGLWVPPHTGLHVAVARDGSRLRSPDGLPLSRGRAGLRLHWWPLRDAPGPVAVSTADALARVVRCQPPRYAVAVIDSALHAGLIDRSDLSSLMSRVPARRRLALSRFDPASESGIESLVRFDLEEAGMHCQSQVVVPGIGRVDLLIEGRVIVEVDGREWHGSEQARDYRRDLLATARGAPTVRVDYRHAVEESPLVIAAVRRAVRRRRPRVIDVSGGQP